MSNNMTITKEEHRNNMEIESIRAGIEQTRIDTALASKKLAWYERLIYGAIGAVAVNGLPDIITAIKGLSQ